MQDDPNLERELSAFGRTLESATGEPIRSGTSRSSTVPPSERVPRRWWALGGAAAAVLVAVVGLAVVANRGVDDVDDQISAASTTIVTTPSELPAGARLPDVPDDPFGLADVGWQLQERVEIDAWQVDDAFLCGSQIEAQVLDGLPVVRESYERGPAFMTAVFVDLGDAGAAAERFAPMADAASFCRALDPDIDDASVPAPLAAGRAYGYSIGSRLAMVIPGGDGRAVHLTTGNIAPRDVIDEVLPRIETFLVPPLGPVPADPLGLEADGWRLVERDDAPFSFPADIGCRNTDALVELNGAPSVRDILQPPDSTGLDVDVNIVDVGSPDVGGAVADGFLAFGECVGQEAGAPAIEISAMSSIRASWFRAGSEFAIVTVVGDGPRTVILEIENAPFDDDLIADLAQRSASFLGDSADPSAMTTQRVPSPVADLDTLALPDDPLGLEADGWTLTSRDDAPAALGDLDQCTEEARLGAFVGARQPVDVLTPNEPAGDVDSVEVTIIETGTSERGRELADIARTWADCRVERLGVERRQGRYDEAGAIWHRVNDLLEIVVIGDGPWTVVIDVFGDLDDTEVVRLSDRAGRFLAGRPTAVERRPLTDLDGDPYDVACDDKGPGFNGQYDYSPEAGPDEPTDRAPRDAFLDGFEQVVASSGRRPVAEGWTEWFAVGDSYFVLEIEGRQAGLVTVAGWPDTGVWRFNSIELCEAAFGTDLDR